MQNFSEKFCPFSDMMISQNWFSRQGMSSIFHLCLSWLSYCWIQMRKWVPFDWPRLPQLTAVASQNGHISTGLLLFNICLLGHWAVPACPSIITLFSLCSVLWAGLHLMSRLALGVNQAVFVMLKVIWVPLANESFNSKAPSSLKECLYSYIH